VFVEHLGTLIKAWVPSIQRRQAKKGSRTSSVKVGVSSAYETDRAFRGAFPFQKSKGISEAGEIATFADNFLR